MRGSRLECRGLLEPFPTQTWIAVSGWGRITGLGSCASDLVEGLAEAVRNWYILI